MAAVVPLSQGAPAREKASPVGHVLPTLHLDGILAGGSENKNLSDRLSRGIVKEGIGPTPSLPIHRVACEALIAVYNEGLTGWTLARLLTTVL